MLLDCTLGSLQLFRDFVSRGFEQTFINLTAIKIFEYLLLQLNKLTLFDIGGGGGGMMASQNVFDHCAQTRRRRKLKLGNF